MRSIVLLILAICLSFSTWAQDDVRRPAGSYQHRIAFTPISGIVAYSYINPGMGFDYEYILSPEKGIGVHIPFAFGFDDGLYSDYRHTSAYIAPGLLFHTGRPGGRVDFAIGPSVLIGNMHFRPYDNYYYPYPQPPRSSYNYSMIGFLVDNSLNFTKGHFQFGFDVRMGPLIEERNDTRFFIHFGMHFGGIF